MQAAQRRLQNLERDLRPLADRMKALWVQAEQIAEEQPERGQQCRARVQELEAMHGELLAQARTWIEEAERSQGQQMFEQVRVAIYYNFWSLHLIQSRGFRFQKIDEILKPKLENLSFKTENRENRKQTFFKKNIGF